MKIYLFFIFLFVSSTSLADTANQNILKKDTINYDYIYYSNQVDNAYSEIVKSIKKEEDEDKVVKTLAVIFSALEHTDDYSEYQKYLLKMQAVLLLNSTFVSDDIKSLKNLSKKMLPISICSAYQFKENSKKSFEDILNLIMYDENRKIGYSQALEYFNSEEVFNNYKTFIKKNSDSIPKVCAG